MHFFVAELQQKLGIPIGLLHCSFGGTVTETWCSPAVMAHDWPGWQARQKQVRDNPKVPERNKNDVPKPTAVRHAAEDDMGQTTLDVNLGNREALPASPFAVK